MQIQPVPEFSRSAASAAQARLDSLAKLPGSLGVLEALAVRLAGITGQPAPRFSNKAAVLFAADHAIARHGLSSTGQEITALQVRNFLLGGGTINAFCRNAGASLHVVDVGVDDDLEGAEGLIRRKVMRGAHDFSCGPAMSREEALQCVQVGMDLAHELAAKGVDLLATGEMGIGNTSPSSAMTAVFTGKDVAEVTGVGSGLSSEQLRLKVQLLERGIVCNQPNPEDPIDVLAKVGGPEIGAMAGLMLGGASLRIPVVVDGFIAGVAAALACRLEPRMSTMLIGSHLSAESGHRLIMQSIGVPTYFDFGLRLGEGTGAVLLFPIIEAATRLVHEMRTLKDLGV